MTPSNSDRHAVVQLHAVSTPEADMNAALDAAIEKAKQVFGSKPQVVFCIFKAANDERYNIFKFLGEPTFFHL